MTGILEKQVGEFRLAIEGVLDLAEEHRADDAAAPPDHGDAAVVQVPVVRLRRRPQELVALGVGNDLRGVERILEIRDHRIRLVGDCAPRPLQDLRG